MIVEEINLYNDWVEIVKGELENKGYSFTGESNEEISIQYYNYLKRVIPAKPRKIVKSNVFTCPQTLVAGLTLLESKILSGEDVLPHLSRKLKNLDEIDDLLYDWGIFHLHLGTTMEDDGYISRTGPLLFGFYDDLNFYFLNVMPHGSWTRQEMLRTIHTNWPQTIDDYLIKGDNIVGLEYNVTDEEIKGLRKASINVLIEVEPAIIYATPGGGFVSSGHSSEVIMRYQNNQEHLEDLENSIKENPEKVLKAAYGEDLSFINNINLKFKLIKADGKHMLLETNNDLKIQLSK